MPGEILNRPPLASSRIAPKTLGESARQAQPVYGTVHIHQGRCMQVADDPVVLYGLVARHALSRDDLVGCACRLVDLHLPASSSVTGFYGRVVVTSLALSLIQRPRRARLLPRPRKRTFVRDCGVRRLYN